MKITCNRLALLDSLNGVSRAVTAKTAIPALDGILFQCDDNTLKLTAYDLEIGIVTFAEAEIEERGEIVINSRLLLDMLRKCEGESVSITADNNLKITIKSGITQYSFVGIPASDFPEFPSISLDQTIVIPGKVLKNLISRTIYAVSLDTQKPVHMGSKFIISGGSITVASVDGHRLAIANKDGLDESINTSFVVPAKTLNEVSKLITDEDEDVRIGTERKNAVFTLKNFTIITRLLEGEFLDFRKSIKDTYSTLVTVKTDELINAVERASTLITDRFKTPVVISIEENSIKVSCNAALGSFYDEVNCETEGNNIRLGFNYRFLLDALKYADTDEIKIQINEQTMPISIKPVDSEEFIFLVLPVRLR